MPSTIIYIDIKPTYLYIKQHSVTGLKYFGKTTSQDPKRYLGSGKHWKNHINAHGKEFVETIWVSDPYTNKTMLTEFALTFSKENNIVESKEWANLIPENGISGAVQGKPCTEETKSKIRDSKKGKPGPNKGIKATKPAWNKGIKTGKPAHNTGKPHSIETRAKMSTSQQNRQHISCPHCNTTGVNSSMKRWHFENCKVIK